MNIFVLSADHRESADALCDVHLTKMPLESVQILNTALHIVGRDDLAFYGRGYVNHPCCTWAAESFENWMWLYDYACELGARFERERGKPHSSITKMAELFDLDAVYHALPDGDFTDPPQCMPDDYKCDNIVTAYRAYYRDDKARKAWFNVDTCANTCWLDQ